MTDPARQADITQQTSASKFSHITSTPSSTMLPPQQTSTPFHYPSQMYLDPVASATATASALYQQQRMQQSVAPQASMPPSSATLSASPQRSRHQNLSQSLARQPLQQNSHSTTLPPTSHSQAPYYLPEHAATAVALQQMQIQMQLQMQHATSYVQAQPTTSQQLTQQVSQLPLNAGLPPVQNLGHPSSCLVASSAERNDQNAVPPRHHGLDVLAQSGMALSSGDATPVIPESQMLSAYRIGRYTPAERRIRLERYREKRAQRNYNRRVKYDCRKMIADKRRRVQGRFVKREEEMALAGQTALNSDTNGATAREDQGKGDVAEDGTEDGTEDETKVDQPPSIGSGSSGHPPPDPLTTAVRGLTATMVGGGGEPGGFCEQSEQVLQQFR